MIVQISTSGGIGGFGLGKEARVDVNSLPELMRVQTCEILQAEDLAKLEKSKTRSVADGVSYVIRLEGEDGIEEFKIGESEMAPEMLDLVDDLMAVEADK